jgi:hypothetical protein
MSSSGAVPAVPAALVAQLGLRRARDLTPAPDTGTPGAGMPARHILPVTSDISRLLPHGGLAASTAIAAGATGAVGLLWRLLARPTSDGSWCAIVGLDRLYPPAAAAAGADLDRIAFVRAARPRIADAANALAEGLAVLVVPSGALTPAQTRRLTGKARRAGAVLVWWETRPVTGVDARLGVTGAHWEGLRPNTDRRYGAGALRSCELDVQAAWRTGRGARHRIRPYGGEPEPSNVVPLRPR